MEFIKEENDIPMLLQKPAEQCQREGRSDIIRLHGKAMTRDMSLQKLMRPGKFTRSAESF